MGLYDRDYIRDDSASSSTSFFTLPVTTQLVVVNGALFLLNLVFSSGANPNWLTDSMAMSGAVIAQPWNWWKLLTAGFAHDPDQIRHILFNMIGLWFIGHLVEPRLGRRRFLEFYLGAILFSAIVSCGWRYAAGNQDHVLGASGGVVAVVVMLALVAPHERLLVFFVSMPAWGVALLYVGLDVLGTMGDRGRIAHDVHLAGAAFAVLFFYGVVRRGSRSRSRLRVVTNSAGPTPSTRPSRGPYEPAESGPDLDVYDEPDDDPDEIEAQGDRVLEKMHREGEESLTRKERRILEAYSRHMRRKRR